MSRCNFENSQISAQHTVGVAGDDIMFHILVLVISDSIIYRPLNGNMDHSAIHHGLSIAATQVFRFGQHCYEPC